MGNRRAQTKVWSGDCWERPKMQDRSMESMMRYIPCTLFVCDVMFGKADSPRFATISTSFTNSPNDEAFAKDLHGDA